MPLMVMFLQDKNPFENVSKVLKCETEFKILNLHIHQNSEDFRQFNEFLLKSGTETYPYMEFVEFRFYSQAIVMPTGKCSSCV